jgi:hypothetical protein
VAIKRTASGHRGWGQPRQHATAAGPRRRVQVGVLAAFVVASALVLAGGVPASPAEARVGEASGHRGSLALDPTRGAPIGRWPTAGQVTLPEGCRLPSEDQVDAGGALEGVMLALHGLVYEPVPLEQGVAFGDPGPCPGGSLDAYRGVDIMGWVMEVSGPAQPDICSPEDPPITELPLRSTRCVDPSTTVASRNARVPFPELRARAPFPLLLPSALPDGLLPHWTTLRVTDWRADQGHPRQYGTVLRFRGTAEAPWLLLLEDTGDLGGWMLETLRADTATVPLRGTRATVLDTLPDYDGPGSGLLWEEGGMRYVLFGTYSVPQLTAIAAGLAPQPAQARAGRRLPQSVAAS